MGVLQTPALPLGYRAARQCKLARPLSRLKRARAHLMGVQTATQLVSLDRVERAAGALVGRLHRTPTAASRFFSSAAGAQVRLKLDRPSDPAEPGAGPARPSLAAAGYAARRSAAASSNSEYDSSCRSSE